jgi:hypothetical protein
VLVQADSYDEFVGDVDGVSEYTQVRLPDLAKCCI